MTRVESAHCGRCVGAGHLAFDRREGRRPWLALTHSRSREPAFPIVGSRAAMFIPLIIASFFNGLACE